MWNIEGVADLDFKNDVTDTRLENLRQNDDLDDRMKKLPYMKVVIYHTSLNFNVAPENGLPKRKVVFQP